MSKASDLLEKMESFQLKELKTTLSELTPDMMNKVRSDSSKLASGPLHSLLVEVFGDNITSAGAPDRQSPRFKTATAHVSDEGTASFRTTTGYDGSDIDAIDFHQRIVNHLKKDPKFKLISKGVSESSFIYGTAVMSLESMRTRGGGRHDFKLHGSTE